MFYRYIVIYNAGGVSMFIETIKNNGKPYLRLVHAIRKPNKNGDMVSTKHVILNIGPLDRFDDGQPNYIERLKKSFKAGNPLISELIPYCNENRSIEKYSFSFTQGSPDCFGHPKIFSYILLEKMLEELGLNTFFSSYKAFTKIKFDVYGFAKLLLFGRLLHPASKQATIQQNKDYFEPILSDGFNPDNVYDTLTFIFENKDKIIRRLNTNLVKKANRSPEIIYYDVTNFYFEIEKPDEDILDENGEVSEKGLRKKGVSKEERKLPIVQMGLFMDDSGIPIAIESFPGNTLDHLTLRPSLKKNIDNLDYSRFLLVADRGICNYRNLLQVLDAGNGYIVSKSLLKSTMKEQQWAYCDEDYIQTNENFKYKSRIVTRKVKDEKGNQRTIEEKVVVYWSKKFHDRSEYENKSFLDFLEKLEESPANFRITALQAKSLKKFFKKDCVNIKTGELIHSNSIKPMIDFDKVQEYKKSMGYYQIVSSELNMDPLEIIEKYHGLTQIEDQFRVMKSDLETRPIYVRTKEHIEAHLLICMISLIMLRLIQKRILSSGLIKPDINAYWNSGLNAARIQNALNKWKVDLLPEEYYRFMDIDDPDLKLILDAFDIQIPAKLYRRGELKSIKTNLKIFK